MTEQGMEYYSKIITDLMCGEVHSITTGVAGMHTKRGGRKLILHICCKNGLLNTYQTCGIAVVCPNPTHSHHTVC